MRLVEWRPMRRNNLPGFATVELGIGLRIGDIPICTSHGRTWASLPSKPIVDGAGAALRDDRGKIRYSPILSWRDRNLGGRWSDAVVALVRAAHPGALDAEGAP
jgi:hypothetical protein